MPAVKVSPPTPEPSPAPAPTPSPVGEDTAEKVLLAVMTTQQRVALKNPVKIAAQVRDVIYSYKTVNFRGSLHVMLPGSDPSLDAINKQMPVWVVKMTGSYRISSRRAEERLRMALTEKVNKELAGVGLCRPATRIVHLNKETLCCFGVIPVSRAEAAWLHRRGHLTAEQLARHQKEADAHEGR